jgi:DNA-binding XRE family transcriptional regulator
MYANLLGQKAYHHLTDEQMAAIIGVSRNAYVSKMKSGRFWPNECQAYCKYFNKPFDFLFAVEDNTLMLHG